MDTFEGLRQRASSKAKETLDSIHSASQPTSVQQQDRAFNLESVKAVQEKAAPLFVFLASVLEAVEPAVDAITKGLTVVWTALEPYHPEDLFVALCGLFLVFFGGVFMTLVASCEAAHQFGWDRIKCASSALYVEWTKARAAFERDNKVSYYR